MSNDHHTDYASALYHYNAFMQPMYRSSLSKLWLEKKSYGLDAGCGAGGLFGLLDEAIEHRGRIIGVDISEPHLLAAQGEIERLGIGKRVAVIAADLQERLPFYKQTFDWVWASDAFLMHQFSDPYRAVRHLVRVTKRGGTIAIFFEHTFGGILFPGQPHLDSIYRRALYGLMPVRKSDEHAENAHIWLKQIGLNPVRLSVHTHLYQAPLDEHARHYLKHTVFSWPLTVNYKEVAAAGIRADEWENLLATIRPDSPDFILKREDYYCLRIATLAQGIVF